MYWTARIPGKVPIKLVVELLARQANLLSIDDDDTVAMVGMGSKIRAGLAGQNLRRLRRQPSQNVSLRVKNPPPDPSTTRLGKVSPHSTLRIHCQMANFYF